jgi:hypothetical protein
MTSFIIVDGEVISLTEAMHRAEALDIEPKREENKKPPP